MHLNGLIFQDGGCWLADIAGLDFMVQGDSREDVYETLVETFHEEFPKVDASFSWLNEEHGVFTVRFKKPGQVLHEMVKRQREACSTGLSEITKKMKSMTHERWKEVESGEKQTTTAEFLSMLDAMDLDVFISVKKRPQE